MKRKKKIYVIIFIIAILILCFLLYSAQYIFLQEDLLFFHFFNDISLSTNTKDKEENKKESRIKESTEQNYFNSLQVYFKVQSQKLQSQDLNLFQTLHPQTLVYEKIAPGTKGNFDIVLYSKEQQSYEITFKSENEKPTNLQFYITENEKYNTLEALDDTLKGDISKNEEKKISVYWEWCYEQNEEANKQDTLEAKQIRNYHFLIYVKGN